MEKNKTWTGPESKLTEDIPMEGAGLIPGRLAVYQTLAGKLSREEDMPGTEAGKGPGRQQPEKEKAGRLEAGGLGVV